MTIKEKINKAQSKIEDIQGSKVRITFETKRDSHFCARYQYSKGVTDELVQAIEAHHLSSGVCWRVGTHYDLDNKPNLDIDVDVNYDFEYIEKSVHKHSETQFEVHYAYKASVSMSKENATHFLHDLSKSPEVQDLMFTFLLNGEELIPDEHPDLFLDFALFSPLVDLTIDEI